MLKFISTRRISFLHVAFILLIASADGSEQTLLSSMEPSLSPEPSFEASAEPTPEPELPPMGLSTLVEESYMRHVDYVRQGLPMGLVRSFYNHALKTANGPGCVLDNIILGLCTTPLFDENDGYAAKSLQKIISEDESRPVKEKYFPDLLPVWDLPEVSSDEDAIITAAKSEMLQKLSLGPTNGWDVSVLPSDEEIRFDPGKDAACTEMEGKVSHSGLTMTASSLTAFVLGMTAQIILINGESPQARMILENHVKLMYLAARCDRTSGDNLEVPTQQLHDLIRRAKLSLLARSVGDANTGLPPFEFMDAVIDGSRHFFEEEIERMSSMNSFGRINYITWTGDSVSSVILDSRMAGKTTLEDFKDYYEELAVASPEPTDFPCPSGFSYQDRLSNVETDTEKCCAETCLVSFGRRLDLFIVNEMCCHACSEEQCDLSKLARVIEVEAFRFSRSGNQ